MLSAQLAQYYDKKPKPPQPPLCAHTMPDPFLLTGTNSPEKFAQSALNNGPSKNASKRISKIELLKDTRVRGHWRHEFLVFSVDHEEGLCLYFEREFDGVRREFDDVGREFDGDSETWKDMAVFAWKLFQGYALDNLEFCEPGCEKDVERKSFAKTVFQINLRSPFTLKDLAKILDSVSYEEKYPTYGLFSANCWAWARGFLFDILFNSRIATSEILMTNGREMIPITVEEMRLYLLTDYGAYGRLLLHFSSDDFNSQYRTKAFPESLNRYGIRIVLLSYSILRPLMQLKSMISMIIGPSNWTVSARKLLVYHDRTLENWTEGPDCTFRPLHPNFTGIVPITPGHMDYALPSSFCQPGKYLYLLTSPVCSSSQPVSAIHVYVFGATSDVPGNGDTLLSCGIIRRSEDNGELIEVASTHVRLITCPRGIIHASSPVEYSMIRVFNSDEEFTKEIKNGDMIALWAHSYREQLHTPRSASIKVIVSRGPVRIIDCIFASVLLFEAARLVSSPGGSCIRFTFSAIGCLLFWTSTYYEGWLWYNLSALARTMHASGTPLSFPTDSTSKHDYSLPAFLQEPITSDIFSAPLHSIELFQEISRKEIVIATFSHQHISNYVIHFIGPSAVNAGWLHYLSFLTTTHRLDRDEVRIFREGGTERTVRKSYVGQSILMIRFKAGGNPGNTKPTTFELELRSIVNRLNSVQRHYWWYFWLNSRYWTWQWWLLKAALHETAGVQDFIEVEGRPCCHEEAAILLNAKYKQWSHAYMKEYDRGLPRLNDAFFVATQTRLIWIILVTTYLWWHIHPKVHTLLIRFFPFLDV